MAGNRLDTVRRALKTACVTGTNGKTTTTSMIAAIVAASGEPSARITTVGAWVEGERISGATPTEEFKATVERALARGVRTIAVETTSKALAAGFSRRWPPDIAVFTNLTRDHLDMHETPEAYLAAKAQLFLAVKPGGVAVVNADDPSGELIASLVPPHATVRRFSMKALRVETAVGGTRVLGGPLGDLELRVTGDVHAANATAAALAADALGYSREAIARGLADFPGVPGRFQVVHRDPLVVVDYAHTPDGLEGTLRTARALVGAGARLVCVFGCGGDRDRGKRPEMGAIAHRAADVVWLTSDNPRREDPATIAAAVRAGASGAGAVWHEELDRRAAIFAAVAGARGGDVVIIAGKGHEEVQEIGDEKLPFSDAEVALSAFAPAASASPSSGSSRASR